MVDDNVIDVDGYELSLDDDNIDKDYEQAEEVDDEATMEEEEALPELEDPLREIQFLEEVIHLYILEFNIMIFDYHIFFNSLPYTCSII